MRVVRLVVVAACLVAALGIPRPWAAVAERALLGGDWQTVADTLERDDSRVADPAARLLMAHARLATNHGNDAALLFRSVAEPDELAAWRAWTQSLAAANPANPVALYLAGDAQARSGELEPAIDTFDRALAADPGFALAHNARGVALVVGGDPDAALAALYEATLRAPTLADAHASFGTLAVLQGWAPSQGDQGLRAFEQAIQLDPGFALAWNGRGSLYFGDGEFESAAADFRKAAELMPSLTVAEVNEGLAFAYALELATVASLADGPAMTMESRIVQANTMSAEQAGAIRAANPDPAFWQGIREMPELSRPDQAAFMQQYGPERVQQGLQVHVHERIVQTRAINQEVQNRQAGMESDTKRRHGLAIAEAVLPMISFGSWKAGAAAVIAVRGPQELLEMRAGSTLERQRQLNLQAAQAAREVRQLNNLPVSPEIGRSGGSAPSPGASFSRSVGYYCICPAPSAPRPGGVSTKELALAFVNRGSWPVLTTFTLGYGPADN